MARRNDFVTAFRHMKSGGNPFDRAQAERKQAEERQKRLKEEAEKRKAEKEKREAEEREAKRKKEEERAKLGAERKRKDEEMRRNSNALDSYETFGADPIADRATQMRAALKRRKELEDFGSSVKNVADKVEEGVKYIGDHKNDINKMALTGLVDFGKNIQKSGAVKTARTVDNQQKTIDALRSGKERDGYNSPTDWYQDKLTSLMYKLGGEDVLTAQEELNKRRGFDATEKDWSIERGALGHQKTKENLEHATNFQDKLLEDNLLTPEESGQVGEFAGNVVRNAGSQAVPGLLRLIPGAGKYVANIAMADSMYGQAYDLMKQGFDYEKSRNKALADATIELGTENALGKLPFDISSVSDVLGEGVEEYTNERLSPFTDMFLKDYENSEDVWNEFKKVASENALWKGDNLNNALLSGAYGMAGAGLQGMVANPTSTVRSVKDTAQNVVDTTKNGVNIVSNAINNTDNYQRNQEISALKVKYNELQDNIATVAATDPQKAKAMKAELDNIREVLMQQADQYANPETMSENSLNRRAADSALKDITQWTDDANAYQEELRQEQLAQEQADYEQQVAGYERQVAEREAQIAKEQATIAEYTQLFDEGELADTERLQEALREQQLSNEGIQPLERNEFDILERVNAERAQRFKGNIEQMKNSTDNYAKFSEQQQKNDSVNRAYDQMLKQIEGVGVKLNSEQKKTLFNQLKGAQEFHEVTGFKQETPKMKFDGLKRKENNAVSDAYTDGVDNVVDGPFRLEQSETESKRTLAKTMADIYNANNEDRMVVPDSSKWGNKEGLESYEAYADRNLDEFEKHEKEFNKKHGIKDKEYEKLSLYDINKELKETRSTRHKLKAELRSVVNNRRWTEHRSPNRYASNSEWLEYLQQEKNLEEQIQKLDHKVRDLEHAERVKINDLKLKKKIGEKTTIPDKDSPMVDGRYTGTKEIDMFPLTDPNNPNKRYMDDGRRRRAFFNQLEKDAGKVLDEINRENLEYVRENTKDVQLDPPTKPLDKGLKELEESIGWERDYPPIEDLERIKREDETYAKIEEQRQERIKKEKETKAKEIKKALETEKNMKVEPDSPEDRFVEKMVEHNAKDIETEDNIKEVLQDEEFIEAVEEEMYEDYDDGYYDYYDEMYQDETDTEPEVEDIEPEVENEQPKAEKKKRNPKSDKIFDESKMTGADETREQVKKKKFSKEHTIETFKKLKDDPNMPKELKDFIEKAIKQKDKGFRAETLNLESLTRSSNEFIDRNGYENAKNFIDAVYKNTTTFDEKLQHAIERTALDGKTLFQTKESAIDGIYKGIDTRTQDLMNTMIGKASANARLIKETYEKTLSEIESKGLIARNVDGNIRIIDANGADVTNKHANVAERLQNEYEGFNYFVNDILAYQTALSQTKSYAGQTLRLARKNHFASKEYQAKKMQEQVDQLNDQIKKSFIHKFKKPTKVKLNQDLFDQYMKAENNIERAQIMEDIQMDLARQMPPTIRGWYDQTRYTAMLFHVPTHGRNLVGNALTGSMFNVKDGLRYVIEKHLEKSGKIAHDSYDNSNPEHNKINSAVEGMLYSTDLPGIDSDSPIMKQNNVSRDYGEWLKLGGNKKAFFEKRGYDGALLDDIVKSDATSSDEFTLMKNVKMNKYLSKRITSMMIDDGVVAKPKGIMPNEVKLVDKNGNDIDTTAYINKAYNSVENQVLSEEDLRTSNASKEKVDSFKSFASNIYEQKQAERAVTNDTKFRMKSGAQQYVNNWGNNWAVGRAMGKISKFNSDMLNKADILFLKPRFEKTLSKSLAAQGYTIEGNKLYKNGKALTNEQQTEVVDRLSDKALQEAKEATFHDESVIANALNRLINDTGKAGVAISVVQPFVQTPVNVFRRGVEFSPIGLATSAAKFKTLAENGQTDKAINEVCKGLTGTGIALMGALLNSLGVLDIDLGDDEEKKEYNNAFSRMFGRKNISVKVLGHRIDISNIQPSVIPLAFGAWARKEIESGIDFEKIGEDPMTVTADAIGSMAQPFLYASFMTGITDIAKDMAQSDNSVGAILTTLASTAITQMLPQAGGAFNRVIDDKQRETYTTNATQNVINQAKRKIPFMSTDLEPKIDRYTGEELKNNGGDSLASRAAYNTFGIVPITKELKDPELEEMMRLYGNSKSTDVFPQQIDYRSKLTRDGIEYKLTPKERTKVNKVIGKTWRSATEGFVNSEMYKGMSDAERESVMKKIKNYSLQAGQDEYYRGLPVGSVMSKLNKNCTIAQNEYGLEPYQFFTYNDIEGVKDAETGKTIRNSESLLKLQQLEAYGLGDISDTAKNQVFGISQSVLDMDEEELAVRMEYLDTDLTKKQVKEILETGTFTPSRTGGSGRKGRKGRKGSKGGGASRSSSSKTTDPIALFRKIMNGGKSDNSFSRDVKNRSNFTLDDDLFAKTVFRPRSDKPLTASQLYGMKLKSDTQ